MKRIILIFEKFKKEILDKLIIGKTDNEIYFKKIFSYVAECESFFCETTCTDKVDISQFEVLKLN